MRTEAPRRIEAMCFFQEVGDRNDLNVCVKVLEPEDVRAAFDLAFRRFSQSMDMLLPDRRALAYHADLRWLGKIRGTARARYRDDRLDLSGCGEKVRKLIADAVAADDIRVLVKEVPLFSLEFEEKINALETDDAKASEIEHAIRHEINVRVEENNVFYQSLRERLEAIIEERRQQRLDAADQLSLLAALREELRAGRPGRRTSGSTRGDSRSTGSSNASGRCRCARMPPPTTWPTGTWHPSSPPQLAHHPGPHATGGLRRRPRARTPAAPRT